MVLDGFGMFFVCCLGVFSMFECSLITEVRNKGCPCRVSTVCIICFQKIQARQLKIEALHWKVKGRLAR